MSLLRIAKIPNGDIQVNYAFYKCDKCGLELPEQYPRFNNGNVDYCFECSFKQRLIDEKLFLDSGSGFNSDMFHAGINPENGKITLWDIHAIAPWEKNPKQTRQSTQYIEWRTKIFERDNFTCQKCRQHGGDLNAHHLKSYAEYPKLRLILENGITLCFQCHRKRHKKLVI